MQDTKGKVILSLLAGATAGVVAGLLLAPETGDETRANLKKSASRFGDDLGKLFQQSLARFEAFKEQAPSATSAYADDQAAADDLLNSLSGQPRFHTGGAAAMPGSDTDYDGIGDDTRHFPGYKA